MLPLAPDVSKPVAPSPCRLRRGFCIMAMIGVAAGLLIGEATVLAQLASAIVPGVGCPGSWLPVTGCTADTTGAVPSRSAAFAILSCAAVTAGVLTRVTMNSPYRAFVVLVLGIVAFGATIDLIAAKNEPAPSQHCFRLISALQWAATAGFALGALILPAKSLAAFVGSVLAHMGAASVRILGALAMLTVWPYLPPASAIAMLVVLLVPGVATALTGAVALSLMDPSE